MNSPKDPSAIAAKFTATHQKNVEKAGPVLRNATLGDVLAEILESGRELSRDSLREAIQKRIASTPSARGKLEIKDDIYRAPLEHALALVEKAYEAT